MVEISKEARAPRANSSGGSSPEPANPAGQRLASRATPVCRRGSDRAPDFRSSARPEFDASHQRSSLLIPVSLWPPAQPEIAMIFSESARQRASHASRLSVRGTNFRAAVDCVLSSFGGGAGRRGEVEADPYGCVV